MSVDRITAFLLRAGAALLRRPGVTAAALLAAFAATPLPADTAKPETAQPLPPYLYSEPQIVGGDPVPAGRWRRNFRFVVAMIYEPSGQQFCGASLIDANWVLTAAHCVEDLAAAELSLLINTRLLDTGGRLVEATQIVVHPQYNDVTLENDIALVRLAQPQASPQAIPASPAQTDALAAPGDLVRALGWGALSEGGDSPNRLFEVELPVQSLADCRAAYPGDTIADSMLCAGRPSGGFDTCQGDSGGPLVARSVDGWVQVGITSWGIGCARPNRFGVYTRVSSFRDWIETVISGDASCLDPTQLPAVIRLPGNFACATLGRIDDGSSGLVPIGFPMRVGDQTFTQLSVNNNGHITLGARFDSYEPEPLMTINRRIIAPFLADVDTQAAPSGVVYYGQGVVDGRRAFSAIWPLVGYYDNGTNRLNAFQVTLIELARDSGNFRIEFNFGQIQWEAGDSHGGSGGLGGSAARVGFSLVPGDPSFALELAGSGRAGRLLDGARQALIGRSNVAVPGRFVWTFRNGALR